METLKRISMSTQNRNLSPRHNEQLLQNILTPPQSKHPLLRRQVSRRSSDGMKKLADVESYSDILPRQQFIRNVYQHSFTQFLIALAILGSFVASASHAQIQNHERVFNDLEVCFTVLFTIELLMNLYGHWLLVFVYDGWNVFDTLIVIISWLSISSDKLTGFSNLRLFRIIRIIKRIQELRRILEGIIRSVPSLMNAFIILFIIMGIWSKLVSRN